MSDAIMRTAMIAEPTVACRLETALLIMNRTSSRPRSTPVRRVTTGLVAIGVLASCSSGESDELGVPGVDAVSTTLPTTPSTTASPTTTAPVVATTAPAPETTAAPATVAPTTAAAVETTTTEAAPETTAAPAGPFLRSGDEGPEVAIVQLKLQTAGFLDPGYTDGVFDGATNDAVVAFQGQYGLLVDGVVGPETDRALTAAALSVNPEAE